MKHTYQAHIRNDETSFGISYSYDKILSNNGTIPSSVREVLGGFHVTFFAVIIRNCPIVICFKKNVASAPVIADKSSGMPHRRMCCQR